MKKFLVMMVLLSAAATLKAQQVDSIFLNLYTDSLKKGQHNYINVDGKLSNGKWMPLTSKEIEFSCATAKFEGNQLIIPENFRDKTVTIVAVLRSNPKMKLEKTIGIKQLPDPELPTSREIMKRGKRN